MENQSFPLAPTPEEGLSEEEALRRKEAGYANKCSDDGGKSVGRILRENMLTLFNLLNISLALCVALVGRFRNMLFMGVVISNTVIGTWQELRARRTVRRLQLLNAPSCCVIRGGKERTCAAEEIVQGDLIRLHAGDQVLADGPVIRGSGYADESLLTGESDAVEKQPGAAMMSGSFITEGDLVFRADRVGDQSYAAALTREGREIRRPQSLLMKDLNRIIRFVSIALVPIGLALFLVELLSKGAALPDAVTRAVAAMVGMIPEGLILLTSVALYVGVAKLGRHNTLAQEMAGIETLARADVLCLDKTGTLTTGGMTVNKLLPLSCDEAGFKAQLARFTAAFDDRSGTLDAVRSVVPAAPAEEITVRLAFSSARKLSGASYAAGDTLVLGAPEFMPKGTISEEILSTVNDAAGEGLRVIVLCRGKGEIINKQLPALTEVCGLVFLQDTLRASAKDTLAYFRDQDVTVKIISGDNPRTVSTVACRAGVEGWEKWVDATTLDTPEKLREAVDKYTVFGRVTPRQKRELVEALKYQGHSVAMTGDGVNDIPALKAADCSIAMAGGADATRHAAQIILLDNDFASLPKVVAEGRRVVGNISRAASLFLVKTLYSFALAVLMLVLPGAYPFQPIQLTLISSLTIGLPGFLLALLPNQERIRGNFLQRVLLSSVPGAAGVTLCAAMIMTLPIYSSDVQVRSTLAALTAGAVGLMVLLHICRPLNKQRAAIFAFMAAALAGAVCVAGKHFEIHTALLTGTDWICLAVTVAAAAAIMFLIRFLMIRFEKRKS